MCKGLVIIGAGDLGRELLHWANDIPISERNWRIKGFIDDKISTLNKYKINTPVISTITKYIPDQDDLFVCAIANPKIRLTICRSLAQRGAKFTNIIHPTSIICSDSKLGQGIIMSPYSIVSTNTIIGNHVIVNLHSTVAHDAILEDGVTVSNHCDITGGVHLSEGVFLGSGARILPRLYAGRYSIVGAGSVVLDDVAASKTVAGVPAKCIK